MWGHTLSRLSFSATRLLSSARAGATIAGSWQLSSAMSLGRASLAATMAEGWPEVAGLPEEWRRNLVSCVLVLLERKAARLAKACSAAMIVCGSAGDERLGEEGECM